MTFLASVAGVVDAVVVNSINLAFQLLLRHQVTSGMFIKVFPLFGVLGPETR